MTPIETARDCDGHLGFPPMAKELKVLMGLFLAGAMCSVNLRLALVCDPKELKAFDLLYSVPNVDWGVNCILQPS